MSDSSLQPAAYPRDGLSQNHYVLKRHQLKLVGSRYSIFGPSGNLLMIADRKGFKLKEEIRVYSDEQLTQPLFGIFARQVMDFSAAYDVVDLLTNQKIGVYNRKGFQSMFRDEWLIMDSSEREIGSVVEDSMALAILRRFLTNLIPQNYDGLMQGQKVIDYRQNFNPFAYHLQIDFLVPPQQFDRRMGLAGAILLAAIEGRQRS